MRSLVMTRRWMSSAAATTHAAEAVGLNGGAKTILGPFGEMPVPPVPEAFRAKFHADLAALAKAPVQPTIESVIADFADFPAVQQQLQQVGNILQEFGKNSQWEEINKQWKHDPKDTSIDWAMVEREIPHPEIVQTIKQGMEQKWENQMFEEEVKVFAEVGVQTAWESQCMQDAMDKSQPLLRREIKRLTYVRDNILSINLEEARRLDPELFQKLDAEVDQLNWDDDPAAPETFAAYNKAEAERRAHSHH